MGHLSNWNDRALFNLSKLYCNIERGQDYSQIRSSIHIGILPRSPFPHLNEFYSEYQMINRKNLHVFSSKFSLYVLDLSQLDNIPEEHKTSDLYTWARLFKATTWEEVQALMKENDTIKDAAGHLYALSAEEDIRLQCEGRELYEMDMNHMRNDGDAMRLVKSVENLTSNMQISISDACIAIGATLEEYERAKARL